MKNHPTYTQRLDGSHEHGEKWLNQAQNNRRALSSVGLERLPYKQEVGGSNPSSPMGVVRGVLRSGRSFRDFFADAECRRIGGFIGA